MLLNHARAIPLTIEQILKLKLLLVSLEAPLLWTLNRALTLRKYLLLERMSVSLS
jgi:hypothetical protein